MDIIVILLEARTKDCLSDGKFAKTEGVKDE